MGIAIKPIFTGIISTTDITNTTGVMINIMADIIIHMPIASILTGTAAMTGIPGFLRCPRLCREPGMDIQLAGM